MRKKPFCKNDSSLIQVAVQKQQRFSPDNVTLSSDQGSFQDKEWVHLKTESVLSWVSLQTAHTQQLLGHAVTRFFFAHRIALNNAVNEHTSTDD
jgi:hypothetical protein